MKVKFMSAAFVLAAALFFSAFPAAAHAQESEAVVVDEVIAQINDGVITLSRVKREMKDAVDSLVREGKTPEDAKAEIDKKQAELIANLINEELIIQKGKEISIDAEVEAQINQRIGQIMKEQNIKTVAQLYDEMRKVNVNPDEFRENMRRQYTRDIVLQTEVDRKVYFGWSNQEIKDYFQKNSAKFTKPETITLSEIFLSFAGRNPDAVRQKADQLIAALRGGADFVKTATENSESPDVATTKGLVGTLSLEELRSRSPKIADAVKDVKTGDFVKAENDEGIEIIRVDARANAGSEPIFNENNIRMAMTYDVLTDERKNYLAKLRKEAYIKIAASYEPQIRPLLNEGNETKTTAATKTQNK